MAKAIITQNRRPEDIRLIDALAFANDLLVVRVQAGQLLQAYTQAPDSLIFLDGDDREGIEEFKKHLLSKVFPSRVFLISDQVLHAHPDLMEFAVCAHFLVRRFSGPAPTLYSRLVQASQFGFPQGIGAYFPEPADVQQIVITRSGQKQKAVEAIQNVLVKRHVNSRLASLIAQVVDELIMNAIFDAPVLPSGMPLRKSTGRHLDFELIEKEHVFIEIASGQDYTAFSVTDQFGSLRKESLYRSLIREARDKSESLRKEDVGSGLALNGVIKSGVSLFFNCELGKKAQITVLFNHNATFKDFRGGVRFLSVVEKT